MPPTEPPGFPPTMPMNASGPLELPLAAPIASALKARAPAMRSPVRDTLIDERMMIFPHCVDARERARRMPGSITLQRLRYSLGSRREGGSAIKILRAHRLFGGPVTTEPKVRLRIGNPGIF